VAQEHCTDDRRLEWNVSLGLGNRCFYEHYACKTTTTTTIKNNKKKTKTAKTTTKQQQLE